MSHGFVRLNWEPSNDRCCVGAAFSIKTSHRGRTTGMKMERLNLLVCLVLICVASNMATSGVDPRGARPVQHGTRDEKCATQREWPFCTSDEWGPKCPSGCRIQGLMDKYDHGLLKTVEKVRSLLEQYKAKHRSADLVSKQTYDYVKEKLTIDTGYDNNYYDLAQRLRQKITDMKIKIDRQLRALAALKDRVKDQVVEMQKLEVDIDIKLRSCKGSCEGYAEYSVDQSSYVELDKQVNQLDSQSAQAIESVGTLYVMKSRKLQDSHTDSIYKSKDIPTGAAAQHTAQVQDMFPEVNTVRFVLEHEGSSSFPATISKEPVCARLKLQSKVGQKPSSHNQMYRKKRCRAKSDVALCSDDDWVSKCPSGCRLKGLMLQMESEVERKLKKVCKKANMYKDAAEKSMMTMTDIYNKNRRDIVNRYMFELKFAETAEGLTKNFTALQNRSSKLSLQFEELLRSAQKQMEDLYRTEVDIDMKLRACYGSCQTALPFSVDHPSYQTLQSDMDQMDKTLKRKAVTRPEDLPHIKLQHVDIGPPPSGEYKTIPIVQRELLTQFEDIEQNQIVLL